MVEQHRHLTLAGVGLVDLHARSMRMEVTKIPMVKINNSGNGSKELFHSLGNLRLVYERQEQVIGLPSLGASMSKYIIKMLMIYLVKNIIHLFISQLFVSEPTPSHHNTIFFINGISTTNKETPLAIDIESGTIGSIPNIGIIRLEIIATRDNRILFHNSEAGAGIVRRSGFMITAHAQESDGTLLDFLLHKLFFSLLLTIIHQTSIAKNDKQISFLAGLMVSAPIGQPSKITMGITCYPDSLEKHFNSPYTLQL